MANLTIELSKAKDEIEQYARDYGLDFFQTIFEVLEFDEVNEVAAYGGFPVRYPHWSFGMDYDQLAKGYEYGLSKIYELVINNDPCYAYLMKSNPLVDQKLVMAHVYGHCDFFKNNYWFSKTNRKMIDEMANHATKFGRFIDLHGFEVVEYFVDVCKSIESLIDLHLPFIARTATSTGKSMFDEVAVEEDPVSRFKSKDYMEKYINPPELIEAERKRLKEEREKRPKFPPEPVRDVLGFLVEHGRMAPWQREILSMIRQEAYYFAPQGQTKIMNEGWASYWHSTIMTQKVLDDSEVIDYADHHSGTVATAPGQLNPYKLGIELFRDIEDRWNRGKFGKEYEECADLAQKKQWNKDVGLGRKKIFEVRRIYNDVTFLDEFLTEEFCAEQKLFTFAMNYKSHQYEIVSREFQKIKQSLLYSLTNMGRPIIQVEDGNFDNRGELLLSHRHEGLDLKNDWARETLNNLFVVWGRPVNIVTVVDGKPKLLSFDGKEHKEQVLETV